MTGTHKFPLLSYQPLRSVYQLLYVALTVVRLPCFIARAFFPSFRPQATWDAKQTLMTRLAYRFLEATARVGITEKLTLEPGKEGVRFQPIRPSLQDVYKGPLASETTKPAVVGGTWYPAVPKTTFKAIFLYFHGGGFVQGDGREATCGLSAKRLLEKGGADAVFALQYRLSAYNGVNPFPAALQDALSSYLYLLHELRIPASQIVLVGDSAGGNLSIALLYYLHKFGATINVPTPKCAVLLSPWIVPFKYAQDGNPRRDSDYVPDAFGYWGANTYAGSWPNARSDPYITQLGHPFSTSVPLFVSTGSAELLYDDILLWVDKMQEIEGNVVKVYHEEGAVHDTFLVAELLGFEKTAWEVAAKIGEFVKTH
ncbi:alpha/beta hydrolase fold-3 domain-containing protein [Xylariaceae sp. AK1471]|nr:alpha/beta hydrolase fold-3 domain-containing protein [Xylariaceae sp. AK1471]